VFWGDSFCRIQVEWRIMYKNCSFKRGSSFSRRGREGVGASFFILRSWVSGLQRIFELAGCYRRRAQKKYRDYRFLISFSRVGSRRRCDGGVDLLNVDVLVGAGRFADAPIDDKGAALSWGFTIDRGFRRRRNSSTSGNVTEVQMCHHIGMLAPFLSGRSR